METGANVERKKVGVLFGFGVFFIPFIFAWFLLRKGYSNRSRAIGFIWLVIVIVWLSAVKAPQSSTAPENHIAKADNKPAVSYEIPSKQTSLIKAIDDFAPAYKGAPNELKKSALRTQRGGSIKEAIGNSRQATNWAGIIKSMATNADGKAVLTIALMQAKDTPITISTWNNALSDIADNTLIQQKSALFSTIADLSEGDPVYFSGDFLVSDKGDYIKEKSLTEDGSMRNPDFLFRFQSIKKAE